MSGSTLAAAELAFFRQRTNLERGDCGAFLYVFHPGESTSKGDGYTAGAVIDDDNELDVIAGPTGTPAAEMYKLR